MKGVLLLATVGVLATARLPAQVPAAPRYPHATEPIGTVRQLYEGVLTPQLAVHTARNIDRLFATRVVPRGPAVRVLPPAPRPLTGVSFAWRGRRYTLEQYLQRNRITGLLVLHDGRIALERYRLGNTRRTRWMSMSIAKSVTSTLIGTAIRQRFIAAVSDSVTRYVPSLRGTAYEGVSIRDVLMMASGAHWNENRLDSTSDRRHLLAAQISQIPGSALAVMRHLPRAAQPGTVHNYSTGEAQVAAEVVRRATGVPLATYLSERIWSRFGMEADARWWLDGPGGTEIGGSGISATLRDYGRFGLFMLAGGVAGGDSMLPAGWVDEATRRQVLRDGSPIPYGYMWWPSSSAASRRDHAFVAEGLYGQFLYVNPVAQVVIVVWSARATPIGAPYIDDRVFFDAVVAALAAREG